MPSARHIGLGVGLGVGLCAATIIVVALVLQFLAPSLSYQVTDRIAETTSGRGNRPFRIGLGVTTGSTYHLATVLNRYLKERAGYELELVSSDARVTDLLDPAQGLDLATTNSASDEAARATGLTSLAALERNYFFVIVPNESTVQEVRDLSGPVNPGQRSPDAPPTLGEQVFEYYGLLSSAATPAGRGPAVTIVRPRPGQSMEKDFESGHHVAVTRGQFLHADLIDGLLNAGKFRLVPVRDHEALARSMPGTEPGFIPAGAYGPGRRVPPEPVPTLVTKSLLVARSDLPGRVARDILDVVYDPRFGRDIAFGLTEEFGRNVGDIPLHPAAELYYHRNDLVTSDRIGRLSFVASIVAATFAATQVGLRYRRDRRRNERRRLLAADLKRLEALRQNIEASPDDAAARALLGEADDLLSSAEHDAAADLLDAEGVQSLRSLHQICVRTLQHRLDREPART
jgi:hypothetical protein